MQLETEATKREKNKFVNDKHVKIELRNLEIEKFSKILLNEKTVLSAYNWSV